MELKNKSTTDDIELYLKELGKDAGITAGIHLGEASYDPVTVFPILIYNEKSCCNVQIGQYFPDNTTDDIKLDTDVLKTAQALLDKMEIQEKHDDLFDVEEIAFMLLDSGEYSLYISTERFSDCYNFAELSRFDYILNNKLSIDTSEDLMVNGACTHDGEYDQDTSHWDVTDVLYPPFSSIET